MWDGASWAGAEGRVPSQSHIDTTGATMIRENLRYDEPGVLEWYRYIIEERQRQEPLFRLMSELLFG